MEVMDRFMALMVVLVLCVGCIRIYKLMSCVHTGFYMSIISQKCFKYNKNKRKNKNGLGGERKRILCEALR